MWYVAYHIGDSHLKQVTWEAGKVDRQPIAILEFIVFCKVHFFLTLAILYSSLIKLWNGSGGSLVHVSLSKTSHCSSEATACTLLIFWNLHVWDILPAICRLYTGWLACLPHIYSLFNMLVSEPEWEEESNTACTDFSLETSPKCCI